MIGQRVTEVLRFGECNGREYTGLVVYVHPQGRFYTVEFVFDKGSFRESFFAERGGNK